MLLAIDRLTDYDLRQCDLRFFLTEPGVEWVDLGQSKAVLSRVSIGGTGMAKLLRDVERGRFSAIVFGATEVLRNPRKSAARNAARLLRYLLRDRAAMEKILLHRALTARGGAGQVPLAGVDLTDRMVVDNARFPVLAASRAFFKRELPQNVFNAFSYTNDRTEESSNTRRQKFFLENAGKLKPCSIGIPDATYREIAGLAAPKASDLFYVGRTPELSVRGDGVQQLQRLRAEGFRVDFPQERLPKDEFYRRAAQAHLCWCPEGHGYESFRTYEVAAAGSVPVLNYPTIRRHEPFTHGIDALFYAVEGDSLYATVKAALQDKPRLVEMGQRARARVEAHHTYSRLAKFIVDTVSAPPAGAPPRGA